MNEETHCVKLKAWNYVCAVIFHKSSSLTRRTVLTVRVSCFDADTENYEETRRQLKGRELCVSVQHSFRLESVGRTTHCHCNI